MSRLDDELESEPVSSPCFKCCLDIDIDPIYLFFPERLDEAGQEFMRVRGIDDARLADLRNHAIMMSDGKIKISHRCQQLDELGLCRIYAQRPQICRSYDCSTRTGAAACSRCTR